MKQPLLDSVSRTWGALAAAVGGSIYVVGIGRICERYTASTDTWIRLTQPTYHHHYGAVVEQCGKLVLLGGSV